MIATTEEHRTGNTAILVCEQHGKAVIRYCTPQEAKEVCEGAVATCSGASMFTTENYWDAKMLMDIAPNIRERVHEAKRRLQDDIWLRDALDKHGVPRDPTLRGAIKAAFKDYTMASIERALRR